VTNGGVYNDDLERFAYMAFDKTWENKEYWC
jgi:hypothetical protein